MKSINSSRAKAHLPSTKPVQVSKSYGRPVRVCEFGRKYRCFKLRMGTTFQTLANALGTRLPRRIGHAIAVGDAAGEHEKVVTEPVQVAHKGPLRYSLLRCQPNDHSFGPAAYRSAHMRL